MLKLDKRILSSLEKSGIYKIPNFVSKRDLNLLKEEGLDLINKKYKFCRYSKLNNIDNTVLCNIVPSRIDKFQKWDKVKQINNQINSTFINSIAKKYLGQNYFISNFIYDYSEKKNEELFKLHFDDFKGFKCLKAYFYLEDCYKENGAFRFIPGSHNLVRKFMELVSKFNSNDLNEIVSCDNKSFFNYLENNSEAKEIYLLLHKISNNINLSYNYCVEGKAGTLLLFDTAGIHGGVELTKGKRFISRIHFVQQEFKKYISPKLLDRIIFKLKKIIP